MLHPLIAVALGATAATALAGSSVRVLRDRGKVVSGIGDIPVGITVHPSSILRASDDVSRRRAMDAFVSDLQSFATTELAGRSVIKRTTAHKLPGH